MRQVFEQKKQTHHYATLKKNGETFEVLLIPDKAIDYKKGKINDVREALEVEQVYSNARGGEIAPDLEKHFGTKDVIKIAQEIINKGQMQLTSEYKKNLQEQKKKEIINIISRNGIDPRNNLPVPVSRIELALEQVNFNIDSFKSAEEQVETILDKIRHILPIRFEEKEIEGLVPQKHAGRVIGLLSKYGKVLKTEWKQDGSLVFNVQIPAGLQDDFMKTMNNITHGEITINLR